MKAHDMKSEIIAVGLTASILLSLLTFAQPTSAVLTTVSGPDEVKKQDTMTFQASIEIREDERIPLDSFNLVIETDESESVTIEFAMNGSVLDITPPRGVVGQGEIRVNLLLRTLDIRLLERNARFGYGYRSGTNERTGEERAFGYGYGYAGDVQPSFAFRIIMDSKAFKHGEYSLHLSVNTDGDDTVFDSNEKTFEVILPSGERPGNDDNGVQEEEEEKEGNEAADQSSDDRGQGNDRGDADRDAGGRRSSDDQAKGVVVWEESDG